MRALRSERQPTGRGDCGRQPCVPSLYIIIFPEFVRYHRSLALCVPDHGVLVLLDCPTPSTLQLALCVAHISYHSKPSLSWCMLAICITFIILFTLNHMFSKKEAYPCTCCKLPFHCSQLGPDGLCEHCFTKICSQSNGFTLRGRCIDALNNGTVDPNDL